VTVRVIEEFCQGTKGELAKNSLTNFEPLQSKNSGVKKSNKNNIFLRPQNKRKFLFKNWGTPDKPTILFIHGFPGVATRTLMTTSPLHESFRIVAMDRPGYGKSDRQKMVDAFGVARTTARFAPSFRNRQKFISCTLVWCPLRVGLALSFTGTSVRVSIGLRDCTSYEKKNFRYLNSMQKKCLHKN